MKKILFLCTGNYYRSRFAEQLFNHLAIKRGLDWEANSRALALEKGTKNVGPISWYAVTELLVRGVTSQGNDRYPQQAAQEDFETANLIIALDETEHLPMIKERFPNWLDTVKYWSIHDAHITLPPIALKQLEKKIVQLVEQLAFPYTEK
jgi:protein-tyrosine phosphatase